MSEHWRWSEPKARKEAPCNACGRKIRIGEKYNKCEGLHELRLGPWRECAHCYALQEIYEVADPWDNERPGADGIGQWEPQCEETPLHALRLFAYWKKRWTRNDGTLYPMPEAAK